MLWRTVFIVLLAGLNACHYHLPSSTGSPAPNTSVPADETTEAPKASRSFTADSLYALLVAELAAQRNQPAITLREYRQQAQETRDIEVVKRTALIAQYLSADKELLDAASLWTELEPYNPEPQGLVAMQLVKQGRLDEAFDQSLLLMGKGLRPLFQPIALQAAQQDQDIQSQLLDRFRQAAEQHPDNTDLLTGEALLSHYLGDDKRALQTIHQAIEADSHNTAAYVLKASLLEKLGDKKAAAHTLRKRVKAEPHNQRLRLQYARLLTELDLPEAQKQFLLLVEKAPMDADLILSLALVSKELEDFATAQEHFEQLLFLQKHVSSAYFYLAQISEQQQDIAHALELYRRVMDGEEYLYATAALCRLYLDQGKGAECQNHMQHERQRLASIHTDSAQTLAAQNMVARLYLIEADALHRHESLTAEFAVLNEALEKFPDHAELRYARSMLYEQANNLNASEADLRVVLEKEPDNADALNALGYTLVNKTNRIQEGYELITRALALEPDNAAILDSMGWALYRLNRTEEALVYLQKAMASFPNHEVAAHLGEVLWVSGKQKEARKIWKQGFKDDSNSPIIKETLQRLKAN